MAVRCAGTFSERTKNHDFVPKLMMFYSTKQMMILSSKGGRISSKLVVTVAILGGTSTQEIYQSLACISI